MTQSQQRGYITLTALLLVVVVALLFFKPKEEVKEDQTITEQVAEDSLTVQIYRDRQQWRKQHYSKKEQATFSREDCPFDTTPIKRYHRPAQNMTIELNSADTVSLIQLRGIGPVFSRRIVKYRQRLGGFVCKEQLLEVFGMTDTLYRKIEPNIVVDPSLLVKINLNAASVEELKSHPYLSYYQAKAIVSYRQKAGPFQSIQDLLKVSLIDEETYRTLSPYLEL